MTTFHHKIIFIVIALCFAFVAHSNDDTDNILSQINDTAPVLPKDIAPKFNRHMHNFNFFLDKTLVRPPARLYRKIVPSAGRRSVGSFFGNLSEPYSAINNFLQGDVTQGSNNVRRFIINTTIGVLGFFDIADSMGHPADNEDLGQTLAVWGVGNGGYLVLPFFGPRTVRGTFGGAGDAALDPVPHALLRDVEVPGRLALQYIDLVNERADNLETLENLEANSLDFYQSVRAFYWQNRLKQINE